MLAAYRMVTLITCLLTMVSGFTYSCIALMTLSEYKEPGSVALAALFILLCVFVLPSMLGSALDVETPNSEN